MTAVRGLGRRDQLFFPAGTFAGGSDPVLVTPELAGWTYAGLRVLHLEPGGSRTLVTGSDELAVLPLAGGCVVECEGYRFALEGRDSVFHRVTDFAYVPIDAEVRLSSAAGCELALPTARASRRLDPVYGPAEAVPVEVRGAGQATRQVNNFLEPSAFPADKLVAVEVLTPDGNWSSYPPHKHDTVSECEAVLEEIYYFRIGGSGGSGGFGLHRTYTADGQINATVTVRDGDVFLIPRGYHGPCVAAPGYPMHYLNVLAGPAPERTMQFCDDPAHHWVRDTWVDEEPDPRCPLTTADGPTAGDGRSEEG
jgi:5-deoxy-glucuronate isomerase